MDAFKLAEIELYINKGKWEGINEFILALEKQDAILAQWLQSEVAYQKKELRKAKRGCLSVLNQIDDKSSNTHIVHAKCNMTLGKVARAIGDLESASDFYFKSLELLKGIDQSSELAFTHYLLANVFLMLKNFKQAEKHYNMHLTLCNDLNLDPWYVSRAHYGLGNYYYYQGLFDSALKEFQAGVELFQEEDDDRLKADIHANLGTISLHRSVLKSARDHFSTAIRIYEILNDSSAEIMATQKLVQTFMDMNEKKKAIDLMENLYHRFKDDKALPVDFLIFRALSLIEDGQIEIAKIQLESLLDEISLSTDHQSQVLNHLFKMNYFEKEYVQALNYAERLQSLYESPESDYNHAVAKSNVGLTLIQLDRSQEGLEMIESSIRTFKKLKDHVTTTDLLYSSVIALLNSQQYTRALESVKIELKYRKKHLDLDMPQKLQLFMDMMVLSKLAKEDVTFENDLQLYNKTRSKLTKKLGTSEKMLQKSRLTQEMTLEATLREKILNIEEEINQAVQKGGN
ncbi:MAG: tetratricopeptide repeat protein [Candidatus Hodarchaeales archaeon]|jgi:tetratricopeptide (TPR) repeat protein